MLKLPPKFVNVPAQALFDTDLPDSVKVTLGQLHGLAWETKGESTPPATVLELAEVRGLKERQMYTHLKALKDGKWIRVESVGDGRIIIHPLRWEPAAALAPDDESEITPEELAALADEAPLADKTPEVTAINCSEGEVGLSLPPGSTAINCSADPEGGGSTAINCSENGQRPGVAAKNCSDMHVLKHVVVDSDSFENESKTKQQHEHESRKGTHAHEELVQAVAEVFMADKATPEQARESAINLVNMAGPKLVRLQLDYFPARCELAKASPKGLRNRSGLLVDSIRKNYPPPPVVDSGEKSWYSQEEFDELIEH